MKPAINVMGSYFISKFRSSLARRFGTEQRDVRERISLIRIILNRDSWAGANRSPSEFGHCRSHDKFVVESEIIESKLNKTMKNNESRYGIN